jgi:hypothetical protein
MIGKLHGTCAIRVVVVKIKHTSATFAAAQKIASLTYYMWGMTGALNASRPIGWNLSLAITMKNMVSIIKISRSDQSY